MLKLDMEIAVVPLLVRMTSLAADAVPIGVVTKPNPVEERLTGVPPPVSATVCGEPAALSAMLTAAASAPEAAGVKVTVMTQVPATATLLPQVLVCEKELAFVPVMLTPVKESAALPLLVSVIFCVAAAAPTRVVG
jgi:hypothetical protein